MARREEWAAAQSLSRTSLYRGSDASPNQRFLHHQAGASGFGLSSYIDDLVLRDRDGNSAWSSASDGTLEQRRYYCQNWRNDVVAIVTDTGVLAERVRYSAYGIPFGFPAGDATGDGITNGAESAVVYGNWGNPTPIAADFNLDGTIDGGDFAVILGNWLVTLGRGKLSLHRVGGPIDYVVARAAT